MALIKSQLVLTDGMTAPLRSINTALNMVINSFEAMQRKSGNSIDTRALQNARSELGRMSAQLGELGKHSDNAELSLGKIVRAIGLVAVARKAFDALKVGIDYASDLAEVQNVVDVTFGSSSAAINSWSKEALNAYGMNEVSAKRYAGTMGAMLKSSGLAGEAITGMSQDMVGLAGDMASFYNLDLETAFNKIRSGISGETEPLKQLGINMSVANLEAYALSQGIEKSYQEMTQAEQVMLRYNYLMNASADAQGDFARTSNSWANQTRLLSESWLQFTGILAEQLLPMLTTVVSWINSIVAFLTEHADIVSAVLLGVATAVAVVAAAFLIWKAVTLVQTIAQWALNSALLASPITWIVLAIALVIGALVAWIQSVGGIKNAWEIFKLSLIVAWNAIKLAFFTGVYWVVDLTSTLALAWKKAGVAIANFLGDLKVSVLTILQNMINSAIDIINGFINALNKIPGVNIGLIGQVTFATTAAMENEAKKQARAADLAAYEADLAAAKAQRDAHIDSLNAELADSVDALSFAYSQAKSDAAAKDQNDQTLLEDISADTAGIATSLKETSEDLKYMRDLAEQEAINRFTTAEVKIDMTGMTNRIDSGMDLDGVLTTLTEGFAEALEVAAEGVHA